MATLNFKGKSAVWNHHLSVPYHTLEQAKDKSLKGKNDTENLIVQGDNLLALKALLPQYQGKVKCIYIDPPYNTGNEGWVYSDNVSSPTIKEWTGTVVGKAGEDLTRHDKWLCMMTPRLKMLRELLTDDGAIFVSIDDNEQHHLKQVMDETFGEECFVADIVWQKRTSPDSRVVLGAGHEYVLVYSRCPAASNESLKKLELSETQIAQFKNPDNDPNGPWVSTDFTAQGYRPNQMYTIKTPSGKSYTPPEGRCWKNIESAYKKLLAEGRMWFGKDGAGIPRRKTYLNEREGSVPWTWWTNKEAGHNQEARKEIIEILGMSTAFDTPKPTRLIKRILQIATDANSIVLDSFAGSGTTAQAVLDLNKEDGGNRKFILVEMEDYANKITAERVRRAVKKFEYHAGFTYYTLGQAIDAESLLSGKLPTYNEFAKYVYYLATGKNHPDEKKISERQAFAGKGEHETIYLIYKPSMDELKKLAITLDWAQTTHEKDEGRKIVYAPACYLDDVMLEQFNIKFVSIPYNLFERQQ